MAAPLLAIPALDENEGYKMITHMINNEISSVLIKEGGFGRFSSATVRDTSLASLQTKINTIYFGMMREKISWFNKIVMPIELSEEIVHRLNKKQIENTSLMETGPFGVSRRNGFRETKIVSKSKRYGHHIFMEDDYAQTAEGRDDLMHQLVNIIDLAVKKCVEVGYVALFNSPRLHDQERLNDPDLRQEDEDNLISHFCLSHKTPTGLSELILYHKREMENSYGVVPDIAITPRGKLEFQVKFGNPQYYSFDKGGPTAVDRFNSGERFLEIQGVKVFDAPFDHALYRGDDAGRPSTQSEDVLTPEFFPLLNYGGMDENGDRCWLVYDSYLDKCVELTPLMLNQKADVGVENVTDFIYVLYKPCHQVRTSSLVLLKSGEKLGKVYQSPHTITVGFDNTHQTFSYEYRSYIGALCDPDKVTIIRHAFGNGLLRGGNTNLLDLKAAAELAENNFQLNGESQAGTYVMAFPKRMQAEVKQFFSKKISIYKEDEKIVEILRDHASLTTYNEANDNVMHAERQLTRARQELAIALASPSARPPPIPGGTPPPPPLPGAAPILSHNVVEANENLSEAIKDLTDAKLAAAKAHSAVSFNTLFKMYYDKFKWGGVPQHTDTSDELSKVIASELYHGALQYVTKTGAVIDVVGCGHHGLYAGPGCRIVRKNGTRMNPKLESGDSKD